jgi:sigma-E factor negative regulatory protein RseA
MKESNMNASKEMLRDEKLAQCLSDFIDDTLPSEDLDYLLEQDSKDWESRLNAYALSKAVMGNTAPSTDLASFDILSGVREGIKDILPDDEGHESAGLGLSQQNDNIVNLKDQKNSVESQFDNRIKPSKKSHVITVKMFAMAASVAFIAVLAGQLFIGQETPGYINSSAVASLDQSNAILESPQDIKTLSLDVNNERLQSYLRQHTEQATMAIGQGMIPMARVVSFSVEDEQ